MLQGALLAQMMVGDVNPVGPMAQLLQVAPLARVRRGLQVSGSVRAFGSGLCWS